MGSLESKTAGSGDRERLRVTFDSAAARYQQARPEYPAALYEELSRATARRAGQHGCWRSAAPPARPRCRWPGAGWPSPAWSSAPRWPPRRGATWPPSRPSRWCTTDFETWGRPGRGSLRPGLRRDGLALGRPGGRLPAGLGTAARLAATWPSGTSGTSSPRAGTRSSARFSRCTTRSARACRPARCTRGRDELRPPGRDRGQRAVRGPGRAPVRLGGPLRRRRVHRPAGHVLQPHRHGRRGSATGCTGRSAGAWPGGPAGRLRRHWGAMLHVARRRGGASQDQAGQGSAGQG